MREPLVKVASYVALAAMGAVWWVGFYTIGTWFL